MSEAAIAIFSVLIGGAISMVTQMISHRREDRRDAHLRRGRQMEQLSTLYEEALFTLDRNARALGRGSQDAVDGTVLVLSRLRLGASSAVLKQYLETADALDTWAEEARQGTPKPVGQGMLMIRSHDSKHQVNAETLFPAYSEQFERLQRMMREHLDSLESAA